jgi:hypothetical protein
LGGARQSPTGREEEWNEAEQLFFVFEFMNILAAH